MAIAKSRRDLLQFGCGAAFTLGLSAVAGELGPSRSFAQGTPASNAPAEDFFYRDDWFGEPWREPETVVLIHGAAGLGADDVGGINARLVEDMRHKGGERGDRPLESRGNPRPAKSRQIGPDHPKLLRHARQPSIPSPRSNECHFSSHFRK